MNKTGFLLPLVNLQSGPQKVTKMSEEGSDIKYLEPGLGKGFSSFCEMIDYG